MTDHSMPLNLIAFDAYAGELRRGIRRQYDRSVNRDLSRQNWQGLFQRNVSGVLQQCYADALNKLRALCPQTADGAEAAESAAARVLHSLDGLADELLQYSLQKHRTTCAISNFPEEHNPSQDYLAQVVAQTRREWASFSAEVELLLSGGKGLPA